jgi:hypothetical protein
MVHKLNALLIGTIFYLCGFVQVASATQQWFPYAADQKPESTAQQWNLPSTPPTPLKSSENSATLYFMGYKIESLKSETYRPAQKELIAEELLRILHKFSTQLASNEQKVFIEAAQSILQYAPEAQKRKSEEWLIKIMDTRTTPTLSLDKRLAIASFLTEFGTEESTTYIRYALKNIDTMVLKNYKNQVLDELAAQDLLNWSRLITAKVQ